MAAILIMCGRCLVLVQASPTDRQTVPAWSMVYSLKQAVAAGNLRPNRLFRTAVRTGSGPDMCKLG